MLNTIRAIFRTFNMLAYSMGCDINTTPRSLYSAFREVWKYRKVHTCNLSSTTTFSSNLYSYSEASDDSIHVGKHGLQLPESFVTTCNLSLMDLSFNLGIKKPRIAFASENDFNAFIITSKPKFIYMEPNSIEWGIWKIAYIISHEMRHHWQVSRKRLTRNGGYYMGVAIEGMPYREDPSEIDAESFAIAYSVLFLFRYKDIKF